MSSWEKERGIFTVGLTGGIGSGKSTVAKVFKSFSVPCFDADKHAHEIYRNDAELREAVVEKFGVEVGVKSATGEIVDINRKALGAIVFSDPSKLEELNKLVHPSVASGYQNWLSSLPLSTKYVIREAAILFESGANKGCDVVLTVSANKEVRLARAMKRDGAGREEIEARMSKQFSDAERENLSDFILHNNSADELLPQLQILHNKFLQLSLSSENDL